MAKTNSSQGDLFDKGMPTKKCMGCGVLKPKNDFYTQLHFSGRRYCVARCKECHQIRRKELEALDPEALKIRHHRMVCKRFGITPKEYDYIYCKQSGVCALCGSPETKTGKGGKIKRLALDHDHETGRIRSLLCMECNSGIGKLRDDPALLRAAADYIEHHRKLHESDA